MQFNNKLSRSTFFKNDENVDLKTNKLIKFLGTFLFCLVPMLVIWGVIAQFNANGENWMLHLGSKFFITNQQIDEMIDNGLTESSKNNFLPNGVYQNIWIWKPFNLDTISEQDINIINTVLGLKYGEGYYFNPIILAPIFGILVFNLILFGTLSFFSKKIFVDIFPSLISIWLGSFAMILCTLMPEGEPYTIPVTIIVIAIIWIGSLVCLNLLLNQYLLNSKFANAYYQKLLRENEETKYYKNEYEKSKAKIKGKDSDSTFVEL